MGNDGSLKVFCSFADADLRFKQGLEKQLRVLLEGRVMTFWGHDQVLSGYERKVITKERFEAAGVILLLLSPDFFDSEQCRREMEEALERHRSGMEWVFLILVRPCFWDADARLRGLPVLPESKEPVSGWRNRDQAWLLVVQTLCQHLHIGAKHRPAIFQARDLPPTYVPRPAEFNAVKRLLLSATSAGMAPAITIVLCGAGGFGKTTLAQALCHDPDIQATFADGILWITLGEKPPNLLSILKDLIASLTGKRACVNTAEQAEARLRDLLEPRSCLIVLDDVWPGIELAPFLNGGPRCAYLITTRDTTRDTSVLLAASKRVLVDAMREAEAVQLLCHGLPDLIHEPEYAAALAALVTDLGEWPLLLTLANSALRDRIESHQNLSDALADLRCNYEAEGVVAFDKANTKQRNAAIERSLAVSLKLLNASEALRYQELAIFPEDVDIPLATVEKLWQATGGLDQQKVKKLCLRLSGLSLLLSYDLGTPQTIRLHDVMRNYLQQKAAAHLSGFHHALLNAYRLPTWGDLLEDLYLWKRLFFHLKAAGRIEELLTTVQDFRYLAKKAFLLGSHTIEADLQEATTLVPHDQSLARLHSRIVQIGHLLNRSETLVNVQCLFLSYLCDLESTQEQCAALEKQIDGVYAKACHSLATSFPNMLYRTLEGHEAGVNGCAISNDGKWIVSASDDGTLVIWSRETGEIVHTLKGHEAGVNGCAISNDGKWIISASDDGTLKIWSYKTGEIVRTLQGHTGRVKGCAISRDGKWIVSASSDQTLKIWSCETGEIIHTLDGHEEGVNGCAISGDGKWIVSASDDGTLVIWDRETGEPVDTLQGHTSWVKGCAISGDGKWVVSASYDKTLKIWNYETGEIVDTLQGHTSWVKGCAISPDGQWVVSGSHNGTLKIWSRETGEIMHTLNGHEEGVNGCAISGDGKWVVSASDDGTLKIWAHETGEIVRTQKGHTRWVNGCAISNDGKFIVSASHDKTLKIWSRETGEIVHTLQGHTDRVNGCAISNDGKWIVSASTDGTLKIWDRETGELMHTLEGHTHVVEGCAISGDGKFIVSASFDETLKIWNRETGKIVRTLEGHKEGVNGCAISPDGQWVVSASWDWTLKIWNCKTGKIVRTLEGHKEGVNGCAISPDGKFIVSASTDGTLKIWNCEGGEIVRTLEGHEHIINGCAISADSRWVVSASYDGTLKVWEMQTGNCLCTLFLETPLHDIHCSSESLYFTVAGDAGVYFFQLVQGNTSTH